MAGYPLGGAHYVKRSKTHPIQECAILFAKWAFIAIYERVAYICQIGQDVPLL